MGYFFSILFITLLAFTPAFAAEGVTETEVKIGMAAAFEGPAKGLGLGMKTGAEAYLMAVNETGGVHGRKITLLSIDDSYEPQKTIEATLKLVDEEKVFALTCFVGTPTGKVIIPIVSEKRVPLVGLFTGAEIFRKPVNRYIFNIRGSYQDEAETLVERLTTDLSVKKFSVFYQDDAFGLAVLNAVKAALKRRGMTLAGEGTFVRNTSAVKGGLASMIESKPDAVIMVGPYTPIAAFVREGKASGLQVPYATVSFVGTGPYLKELGGDASNVIISQVVPFPYDDPKAPPIVKEYLENFRKYFPSEEPGYVSLEGYITAKVLVLGLTRAGRELTRERFIDALEGIKNFELGGFMVDFSSDDHQGSYRIYTTQVVDGQLREIVNLRK